MPSMQWPLGRVIKVHPGTDDIIRTATAQTATSILDRGVKRLVPLPIQHDLEKSEQASDRDEIGSEPQITPHLDIFDRYPLNGGRMLQFANHLSNEVYK